MKRKQFFLYLMGFLLFILIVGVINTSSVFGKELQTKSVDVPGNLNTKAGNSITKNPKWQETSKVEVTESNSFVLKYSDQMEKKDIKNFEVSGSSLVFKPKKIGDTAEAYLTNVGEYGVSIVNMKVSVESLNGKGATLYLSEKSFMLWKLQGNESVKIHYEYFDIFGNPISVSGINYFEGLNKAKDILFKEDELSKIFSITGTNISYEAAEIDGFTKFFSTVSGWSDKQIMGIIYENRESLEFAITNNDPDTSKVAYSSEAPIKVRESPLITKHPRWKNSLTESISKKNYFTMYYNDKIKVSKKTGDVTINNVADGQTIDFKSTSPSSILIENVGFYEGEWISLSVTASGKTSSTKPMAANLAVRKGSFLGWRVQGDVMLNTEYQFLNQKGEPISISGYWTFGNLNSAKTLALTSSFVDNVYSPPETEIRYGVFGNMTEFGAISSGSGDTKKMTITFSDTSKFSYSIRNNDSSESSVFYSTNSLVPIEIPDFKPENKKYLTVEENKQLFTSFYQMIPYEPEHGKKSALSWEIKVPEYIQKNSRINVLNEGGEDVSELFDVIKDDDILEITVKDPTAKEFYNHLYEFRVNWQINYLEPIDTKLLDNQGYLSLVSPTELHVDQMPIRYAEDITTVNFNSNTEIKYQDTDAKELKTKKLTSFITLKPDDLEILTQEKIPSYKYKDTSIDLTNYQYKYTDNKTEIITYKKVEAPVISVKDSEKIKYVNIKDNILALSGEIKLDTSSNYEVHLVVDGKDEVIQAAKTGQEGDNRWLIDPTYRMSGLVAGKDYEAEVYVKDEFSNISNKVAIKISVEGFLELLEVPTNIDYNAQKIPDKSKIVDRAQPYKIKISDLRGPNKKFKLELTLNQYLTGIKNHQIMKQGIVYTDESGTTQQLEKENALVIASGDTGDENKTKETVLEHDVKSGILVNLTPDMKIDTYSASLTWTLVDAP